MIAKNICPLIKIGSHGVYKYTQFVHLHYINGTIVLTNKRNKQNVRNK